MTESNKHLILEYFLDLANDTGWIKENIFKAGEKAGLSYLDIHLLFPHGLIELVELYYKLYNDKMMEHLLETDLTNLKIREKIIYAVKTRLNLVTPYKNAEKHLLSFLKKPHYPVKKTTFLWSIADAIWHSIGDTSVDFNFYTKRLTLSGVYAATHYYWTGDTSEDHFNSWMFLERRIENIMTIEKCKSKIKNFYTLLSPFSGKKNNDAPSS